MKAQLSRFVLVGAIATATTYAVLILGVEVFGLSAVLASALGYLLGIMVNYGLNYRFTFAASSRHVIVFPKFLAVMLVGMMLNAVIMLLCVNALELYYLAAQLVAIGVVLTWSYTANRLWTFSG
jgi:putative flippase GtrA